jgi:murein L,D-transpeptidase YafK
LCLLSAVVLGLSAAVTADPAAAAKAGAAVEEAAPREELASGLGKLGTAHLTLDAPVDEPLEQRLAMRGMKIGNQVMIRIFKAEAQLELWMQVGERFELFATYPICNWSGTLGPKLSEGDKQSPEGLYSVGRRQLHYSARWRGSLDIGYPNTFDRSHARTGSYVLLHGGCTSTGCFAMTDPIIDEIVRLSRSALWRGQRKIPVHVFPFRMTAENMAAHAGSEWQEFWADLKEAHDMFERTRRPPWVGVCNRRYVVSETEIDDDDCPVRATAISRPPVAQARRGRNVMRAYAAARKARLAAKARQRHAAEVAAQRKLPR